jgi:hypothetical protein
MKVLLVGKSNKRVDDAYRILVRKLVGRYPFGRPRRKLEGNVEMDIGKLGCEVRW